LTLGRQLNSNSKSRTGKGVRSFSLSWISCLHVVALFTLAVSHPLYSVLAQPDHAPFFVAHQTRNIDIYLLVGIVSIVLPSILLLLLWLASLCSKTIGRASFILVFLILVFTALLPVLDHLLEQSFRLVIVLALLGASSLTLLYFYLDWTSTFLTIMSVAIILSPSLFLASPPIQSYMAKSEAQDFSITPRKENQPNIVLLVFDELPLISLLEESRQIDPVLYPNFHKLAANSTLFRNTTTTHYATTGAIASLLVGDEYSRYLTRLHQGGPLPGVGLNRINAPHNLFSLLENHYLIRSIESTSKLAGESHLAESIAPPLKHRVSLLLTDAAIIFTHIAVPRGLRSGLPVIEGQWSGFTDIGRAQDFKLKSGFPGNAGVVRQFINQLQKTEKPTLFYLHVLLPHFPFQYTDAGTRHENKFKFLTEHLRHASGSNNWPNEVAANLAWQAHLFQVSFTDSLLGRILQRLENLDMFQESLIIVTADHGISFFWDSVSMQKDQMARIQASESLLVPLLIKLPWQGQQQISDIPVQTIDILPTIADALDLDIPWKTGGFSVLGPIQENRVRYSFIPDRRAFDDVIDPDFLALDRKIQLFGTGSIERLYRLGPHQEIIGRPVDSFQVAGPIGNLTIDHPEQYMDIDLESRALPAYVEGEIDGLGSDMDETKLSVAIAVNGVIRNTATTSDLKISSLRSDDLPGKIDIESNTGASSKTAKGNRSHFLARLPPGAFVKGRNEVTVHAIVSDGSGKAVSLLDFNFE
jgi:hypothetical protein